MIYQNIFQKFSYCAWHLLLSTVLFVYYIVPKHSVRILKNKLIKSLKTPKITKFDFICSLSLRILGLKTTQFNFGIWLIFFENRL